MKASRLARTILGTILSCAFLLASAAAAADSVVNDAETSSTTTSTDKTVEIPCESASRQDTKSLCKIECGEPLAACSESQKVIEILKLLADAYARGDLVTYEAYLDDGCTTFDEGTKKLIVGKQAVLEHLKRRFEEFSPNGKTPLVSYKIEHPYAKVTGDTAVVSFVAGIQVGGKSPYKAENHVTDIFVKHGDKWKKLHYRGRWRKAG